MITELPATMTTNELANIYHVHSKTFLRWTKKHEEEIGKRVGNLWTPKQVRAIRSIFG
ncbi:MAG: hypothetical protein ABFS35_13530 [Bacteroidota bacterium]